LYHAVQVPDHWFARRFFQSDFPGLEVTARVLNVPLAPVATDAVPGSVWDGIAQTTRLEEANLIVTSTGGHDSLADRVLWSNTERVVRHAPCPVLVA
jgi:nucleotide-binding universal stress UspA family protein